jgi:hypothetical protein
MGAERFVCGHLAQQKKITRNLDSTTCIALARTPIWKAEAVL